MGISKSRAITLIAICTLMVVTCVFSQPQWVHEANAPNDVEVTSTVVSQDAQGAYRVLTNWQEGWMEFSSIGIVDLKETANPGQAEYLALTSGRMLAYQKAAEFINGVHVQALTQLDKGLVSQDQQIFKTNSFVENAVVVNEKVEWVRNHGVEYPQATVVIGLLLHGENPDNNLTASLYSSFMNGLEQAGYARPNTAPPANSDGIITGLIIDMRGLNYSPVLFPLVLIDDQEKSSVFPDPEIDRNYAVTNGIVSFAKSIEAANADDRLKVNGAVNAITVKPTRIDEARIYLSRDDAARIVGENIRSRFLDECRVVLIVS